MRFINTVLLFALLLSLAGCAATAGPGHEVVLIEKPILFGHGGVNSEPVKTGLTFIAPTTDEVDVDMQPQQFELSFNDLMTNDGVPLHFDSVIRVKVNDSVKLISKFGPKWYDNNIANEFSNRVRQAVRKHGLNETAISTTAIDDIDSEITIAMQSYIDKTDIPITLIKVTVGRANPPDSIKGQRVETAAQQQRKNTEMQRKLAEDARKEAETSRAVADNAYRQSLGLSAEQFVQLENIHMQQQVCQHNNNCTFIIGHGTPVINTK